MATVTALEKGQEQFDKRMVDFNTKEAEAQDKIAAARKSIRSLSALAKAEEAPPKEDGTVVVEDSDSDIELQPAAVSSGQDDCQQATKKLRTTLQTICARLPDLDTSTPRRRVKVEPPPT